MGIFDRRYKKMHWTGQEITNLILLAASMESVTDIGLIPNAEMDAVIAKARASCIRTETENGFNVYCPGITVR